MLMISTWQMKIRERLTGGRIELWLCLAYKSVIVSISIEKAYKSQLISSHPSNRVITNHPISLTHLAGPPAQRTPSAPRQ